VKKLEDKLQNVQGQLEDKLQKMQAQMQAQLREQSTSIENKVQNIAEMLKPSKASGVPSG
jgi:TolA-binding protein